MRAKLFSVLVAVGLVFGVVASARPATPVRASQGRGFSAVTMEPDAAEAVRAQGKPERSPFPNSANRGRKFNPQGDVITALTTAADQNVIVLFVQFSDTPPGAPAARTDLKNYDDLLFGTVYNPPEYAGTGAPTDRTLYNYYQQASYGKVKVVTANLPSSMGWIQTGHPYSYYCSGDNGFGAYPTNVQGLVVDAVKAVDAEVDFSTYAVNGVVPNLFVVFAGSGAEYSGTPDLIWSHSWSLDEGTDMVGGLTVDGVRVNNYAMMPEMGGDLTAYLGVKTGPYPATVGVYAHEYGHVLGLPDQYDYGYESEGTGNFSLMSGGSWNRYPNKAIFSGNSPSDLDAWSKVRLGFATPTEITSATNLSLPPAETEPVVYKMTVPNSGGKEYFLFENRQPIGFDQGLDGRFHAHGLAIYHVDDTVFTRTYWRPAEAENWKEFRSEGAKKVYGETHYAISLIQADDRWDLEHGANRGDGGDLYPGTSGSTSLTSYTLPNTSNYYFWGGSDAKFGFSGVTVTGIQETVGGAITAQFSNVPWTPPSGR